MAHHGRAAHHVSGGPNLLSPMALLMLIRRMNVPRRRARRAGAMDAPAGRSRRTASATPSATGRTRRCRTRARCWRWRSLMRRTTRRKPLCAQAAARRAARSSSTGPPTAPASRAKECDPSGSRHSIRRGGARALALGRDRAPAQPRPDVCEAENPEQAVGSGDADPPFGVAAGEELRRRRPPAAVLSAARTRYGPVPRCAAPRRRSVRAVPPGHWRGGRRNRCRARRRSPPRAGAVRHC